MYNFSKYFNFQVRKTEPFEVLFPISQSIVMFDRLRPRSLQTHGSTSYRSFAVTSAQPFSMGRWHHISTDIISYQSWDDLARYSLSSTKVNRRTCVMLSFEKCLESAFASRHFLRFLASGRPDVTNRTQSNPIELNRTAGFD